MSFTNWVFTLNNYTPEDEKFLAEDKNFKYVMYGREVAPTTGTPHLQGYFVLHKKSRLAAVKKLLPKAHLEEMRGGLKSNDTYCSKDSSVFERGEKPRDRKRNLVDWNEIRDLAIAGKDREILDLYPMAWIRYDKALKRIRAEFGDVPKELDAMDNYWFYGPPGTGKTTKAYRENPNAYIKETNKWWDDYRGEDTVIIDELELTDTFMAHFLKRWAQPFKFRAESKGGSCVIRPKKIIVTSNYHPDEIWMNDSVCCEAVKRRFKLVYFSMKY